MGTHPKCVQTPNSLISTDSRRGLERAHTDHDQPFRLLDTVLILLRIPQRLDLDALGLLDFIGGSVADEDWLASPFDNDLYPSVR
jgi:hypothetical protein